MPVRLPAAHPRACAPYGRDRSGTVIFVICEFQVVDRDTEAHNELGEASHAKYKERQKKAVMRRLQLGMKEDVATPARKQQEIPERESPTDARKRRTQS